MERKTMPRIVALLLAILLTCTSIFSVPIETQAATNPTKITLSATKKNLCVDKSFTLKVKSVTPGNASKAVTYKSSNTKVATVNAKGKVKGKATGKATITVTSKANKKVKAKCVVTVRKGIEEIQTAASIVMQKGKWVNLRYDITPNKGVNKKVTFKSSKPKTVSVSKKGKITAKKVGKAVITVKSDDGGATKKVNVTVKKRIKPVTKVTLDRTKLSLLNGESDTLHATVAPSNATKKNVYYVSSNTSVARVNNAGRVVGKGEGTAKIYAYASDNMANRAVCTVTVTNPSPVVVPDGGVKVTGVALDRTELVMTAGGDTELLKATVTPANATNPAVIWESNDTTTATVENGLVTPLRTGKTTISVTTVDGGYKASCEVTVNAKYVPVENVILAPSMSLEAGETTDPIVMAVIPTNATNQAVTWSSSNDRVATVSEYGEVTAVAAGTATITVTTADGAKTASCEVTVGARETVRVEDIRVTPKTAELVVGGNALQLNAAITPDNATDKTVVWASANPDVATVSQYGGLVTPLSAGRAMIYAQSNNGQRDFCEVVVRQPLSSVSLDQTELTLKEGGQSNLTVTLNPTDAAVEKVEWSASNDTVEVLSEGVILADGTGRATVRAISAGTARVTVKVTTKDGEYSATCNVTSNKVDIDVTSITLAPSKVTIPVGSTQELMPVLTPSNATVQPVITWTSSNPAVASVNGQTGVITALAQGTATITATTSNGLTATAEITVVSTDNYRPVESITLTPASLSAPLKVGEMASFAATVAPADASEKEVTWSSADESVITVSNTGVVTAVGEGTAKVIATAGGKIASCDVTVYRALDSISLSGDAALEAGAQGRVTATLNPVNATCRSIRWWSGNSAVATVSANGTVNADGTINAVVHAVDAGTAVINVAIVTGDGQEMTQSMTVTVTKPFKALNSIRFIRDELVMQGGNVTNQLTVLFDPEDTTEKDVVWTSSDETIATVDQNGVVTSMPGVEGEATITASVARQEGEPCTATLKVRVTPGDGRVSSITLDKTELPFILGEDPKALTATIAPDGVSNNTVFWISLDENVATVDDKGVVTAVGEGMTTIIAVTQDGGKSAFCNVTVSRRPVPVTAVTVASSDGNTELKVGESKAFTAKVTPEEATYKEMAWSSENPEIATVDPKTGVVTAVAAGKAVIRATAVHDNISGTIEVQVYVPATKVTIVSPDGNELKAGGTKALTANVEPENATYKDLTWSSLNTNVATVDAETGLVTGRTKGKAVIRATAEHDGVYDEYEVQVYVAVTGITIAPEDDTANMMVGDTKQLIETVTPEDADYKEVTWSSENPDVATVDPETGLVTGVAKGTATIKATAEHDGISAEYEVHVFVPATKVILDQSEINVKLNHKDEIRLTATVEPADALDGTGLELEWEVDMDSENPTAVSVVPSLDTMSAAVVLNEGGKATIIAKASDKVYATCEVTVVDREKAFEIEYDGYGDISRYVFDFDKAADEYEIVRGNGATFVTTPEYVEHDYAWMLSKFEVGVYDNNFLKNYWEKFNWETLVNSSYILQDLLNANFLATGERVNVEVTGPTTIEITIRKDGKTKKVTVTRVDLANGGSDLIVADSVKQVRITDINISEEEKGVVNVSATVNAAGGMKLKAKITRDSFTLYRELNGRDRVVIQANIGEEKYTGSVNAVYYEEIMNQLGYVYDPSKMDAYNIYKKAE